MTATRWILAAWLAGVFAGVASPAAGQYAVQPGPDPATGEKYHFELAAVFWEPNPDVTITSEGLGIPGTAISLQTDLGIENEWFYELRTTLRPARKHKFRFDYLPIKYEADTVLNATIIFNGIAYEAGLPVQTELDWKIYNFYYEWDFLYYDRWFVGLVVGAKYNDVSVTLTNPRNVEFASAKGPIPAVGGIARVYFVPNISLTGQFTFFDMPDDIAEDWNGDMYDVDIYGTINFTNNFGAIAGFHSYEIDYLSDLDTGRIDMDGWYFGGVVRF